MAEKTRCEICNRTFKNQEGLEQHNTALHNELVKESINPKVDKKKAKNLTIYLFVLIVVGVLFFWLIKSYWLESTSCKTMPAEKMNIGGHTDLSLHIHTMLTILIDGKMQNIPANIGISSSVMRPLHTHDSSGEIHIEGKCARDFKIGEFFTVWGKTFSSECIFDKCTNNGTLTMRVNGIENNAFDKYVMNDHDEIVIDYKSNS